MFTHDDWTCSAEAMELTLQGNRLVAQELADLVRGFLQQVARTRLVQALAPRRSQQTSRY